MTQVSVNTLAILEELDEAHYVPRDQQPNMNTDVPEETSAPAQEYITTEDAGSDELTAMEAERIFGEAQTLLEKLYLPGHSRQIKVERPDLWERILTTTAALDAGFGGERFLQLVSSWRRAWAEAFDSVERPIDGDEDLEPDCGGPMALLLGGHVVA